MSRTQLDLNIQSRAKSLNLINKISDEPLFCECAYIGSRALADGYMPIARYLTRSFDYFEKKNLLAEHQHIIFSQSKDNIGLMGKDGIPELFEEDPTHQTYHYDKKNCLDGSLIRQAILATGIPKAYAWLGYNCQAYAESIKMKYNDLKNGVIGNMCQVVERPYAPISTFKPAIIKSDPFSSVLAPRS